MPKVRRRNISSLNPITIIEGAKVVQINECLQPAQIQNEVLKRHVFNILPDLLSRMPAAPISTLPGKAKYFRPFAVLDLSGYLALQLPS